MGDGSGNAETDPVWLVEVSDRKLSV